MTANAGKLEIITRISGAFLNVVSKHEFHFLSPGASVFRIIGFKDEN